VTTDRLLAPAPEAAAAHGRRPLSWRPILVLAALVAVIHLVVAARYGWHRDEFYYVICGRPLDWGYVDQPPLAPLIARLAASLPGGVFPLRVLAVGAEVGGVVLAPVLTAEFGGGRRAQTITAAAVAACPVFVAGSALFGTTILDQLIWIALLVLTARALRVRTVPAWLAAGLVAGIGLETKDPVAVLLLGVGIALVVLHRDVLRAPGPWLGGSLAVLLALPNVVWDAAHGWPNLAMAQSLAREHGGRLGSLEQLPLLLILFTGVPLVALWVLGVRQAWSARGQRWVLVVAIVVVVVFTASGGKAYYPAPALVGLFAAGSLRVEAGWNRESRRKWPIALAATGAFAGLVGLPLLPVSAADAVAALNPTLAETDGWPHFVDEVQQVAASQPPGTPIFTSNYGEAGALTMLGTRPLHHPVYSSQNTYALWGPPPGNPRTVLCVGEFDPGYLHRFFNTVAEIEPITMPVQDQETRAHAAIYSCSDPKSSWARMWPSLTHFD
jgi:hypothetical protein